MTQSATWRDLLSRENEAGFGDRIAASEGAYHRLWMTHIPEALRRHSGEADPGCLELALRGGLLADRCPWIFLAGYQAAIRAAFDCQGAGGWLAFAVSEDASSDHGVPGVTHRESAEGLLLTGGKSWVAGCDHLDALVIKSGRGDDARYVLVPAQCPGLSLTARPAASFLGEMSQGRALLRDVSVPWSRVLDAGRVAAFGLYEAVFVYVAFIGYLAAHHEPLAQAAAECLDFARDVTAVDAIEAGADSPQRSALLELDERIQSLRQRAGESDETLRGDWHTDQRVLAMYSEGLRKRLGG